MNIGNHGYEYHVLHLYEDTYTASSAAFTPPSHEFFVNNMDAASSASLEGITG